MDERRDFLKGAAALLALPAAAAIAGTRASRRFPKGFLWGAAGAGHQIEGNNTNSDVWLLEQTQPTLFQEHSGDACNSFELWREDLALARGMGLNSYRFSLEWARIEPEPGQFSVAMLDHYLRIIEGCREHGLDPVVTFNHCTAPRWFGARGGWTNPESPTLFARYCAQAARHLARPIAYATTLNEPNALQLLKWVNLPKALFDLQRSMLEAAARSLGVAKFTVANMANPEDIEAMRAHMIEGHKLGREAIKSVRPDLPVGLSLAVEDDQAVGEHSVRDAKRADVYAPWLEAVRGDDFVGVQNYERARFDEHGLLPPPEGAELNGGGGEVYPASIAGAVRYVHEQTGRPILVTEHGMRTDDDAQRAAFIPRALGHLLQAIDGGVPVLGYLHWSIMDNFEWLFGYKPRYGLHSVDRTTFKRTAKPSSRVLGAIARANSLQGGQTP